MVTAFALVGVMVAGFLISWGVYEIFISRTADPGTHAETFTVPDPDRLPQQPNLEADPHQSLVLLRAKEDSVLSTYGWVDSSKGTVRVPIERAMELYLEQGTRK